jgi:uncharacterized protein
LSDLPGSGRATEHAPGSFCLVGLATSDRDAASAFYAELFGWDAANVGTGEGGGFALLRREGVDVAVLYRQTPQARAAGVAPHWTVFVSVEDAYATAALAGELGGAAMFRDPFDVLDEGRVAALRDPMGATVSLWQPRSRTGAGIIGDVGAWCWTELTTTDVGRSRSFYRELLGWHYGSDGSGQMTIWTAGGRQGGIRAQERAERGVPPRWLPYFGVESVAGAQGRAEQAGGRVREPCRNGKFGRVAVLADPQGAEFGVLEAVAIHA